MTRTKRNWNMKSGSIYPRIQVSARGRLGQKGPHLLNEGLFLVELLLRLLELPADLLERQERFCSSASRSCALKSESATGAVPEVASTRITSTCSMCSSICSTGIAFDFLKQN
eukprot:GILJ01009646.1.p1 GENE.GILJ01009646.1~~GILJ01009646.1.p1  ORF type:complete len:113 (-),score=0.22 GILJ01009646.1:127-465(-)